MCPAALNDIVTSRIERTHVCVRPPSIVTVYPEPHALPSIWTSFVYITEQFRARMLAVH